MKLAYPFLVACVTGAFILACTVENKSDPASPTPGATDGGATVEAGSSSANKTSGLTCLEIFDCAGKCPDENVDACTNECLGRGTAQGKSAATALAQCYETNKCADGDCLKANCSAELTACVTEERPGGKPVDGPAPTGSVPAALVGEWHHFYAPTAHTHDFKFNADGSATEYVTTTSSGLGGCTTSGIADTTGTVVFTDTTLTFYTTGGTSIWNVCGKETVEKAKTTSRDYLWELDAAGNLILTDQGIPSCVENPANCRDTFTKK